MALGWYRSGFKTSVYDVGSVWIMGLGNGDLYKRIRWSWGFAGFTEVTTDLHAVAENVLSAGLVTTIGNGTETPPAAYTNPNDVAPPTERWLWWEQRQPVPTAIDAAAGTVGWRDSGAQEVPDVRTQVLATGLTGGNTLNLWFSYQAQDGAWDTSGAVEIWVATSVLYSTP